MRRLLLLTLLLASFLLPACSTPTPQPEPTPTKAPTSTPIPATSTPKPTPHPDLGISTQALRGVTVTVWHGWDGKSASLFGQMAAEFSMENKWGVKVDVVSQKNLSLLAQAVDSALKTPEHPDLVVALPEHASPGMPRVW